MSRLCKTGRAFVAAGALATGLQVDGMEPVVLQAQLAPPAQVASGTPTFATDIAAMVFTHCVSCHRPDGIGPFSLTTYEDVRARAAQIATAVGSRLMPPWKPEPGYGGPFIGQRRLSDREIERFEESFELWVEAGMPLGPPDRLPPLPRSPDGWRLGPPDLVVTMSGAFMMPADGPDRFRNFVIPVPTDRPRFVAGLEFRPGNARVAHHANLRIDRTSLSRELDAADPAAGYEGPLSPRAEYPDGHFLGWTPGQLPPLAEAGLAWQLEPGSDFVVQLHMQPSGRPELVQASIGLYFTDEPPSRTPTMLRLGRQNIDIPAGEAQYVIHDQFELPVSVELVGLQPHAHFRATDIKGAARFPDGREERLIWISDWDFAWQDVYRFQTRPVLPKGTTVSMEYTYDNSSANPRNPDRPPRRVRFGQFSTDEMGDLWLQVLTDTEADRKTLVRAMMPKVLNEDIVGYESMLAAEPDNEVLHRDVAVLYMGLGRTAAAIRHYEQSLQIDPGSSSAHYNLASLLLGQGQLDEAIDHLRRALDVRPDYAEAHNNLGALLLSQGLVSEAIPHLEDAVRLSPNDTNAHNNLGSAFSFVGRLDEAVDHLSIALELEPRMADAHFNLGRVLAMRADFLGAIEHHRRALLSAPRAVAPMIALARILATAQDETLRNPAEAAHLAETASALTSRTDPIVMDTLAIAYAAAGRFEEAVVAAQTAVDVARSAGTPDVLPLERRLERYRLGAR